MCQLPTISTMSAAITPFPWLTGPGEYRDLRKLHCRKAVDLRLYTEARCRWERISPRAGGSNLRTAPKGSHVPHKPVAGRDATARGRRQISTATRLAACPDGRSAPLSAADKCGGGRSNQTACRRPRRAAGQPKSGRSGTRVRSSGCTSGGPPREGAGRASPWPAAPPARTIRAALRRLAQQT